MQRMRTELHVFRQQVATQKTSTTMKKHSRSVSVPSVRIDGVSGLHIRTESAGSSSSIVSSSQMITVDRKLFEAVMEYIQLTETNCLDSAKLCAQASTGFNTQAYAIRKTVDVFAKIFHITDALDVHGAFYDQCHYLPEVEAALPEGTCWFLRV